MSYELFEQGPSAYIPTLLFSLVVTIFAYGAFPFIFAKTRNTPITKKKYKRLCYGINVVAMFLFMVINGGVSSGAPYFLWTWVFSRYGMKILSSRGIILDGEYLSANINSATKCKSCGYIDKNFFNVCPKCGSCTKEYVSVNELSKPKEGKICFCRKCGDKLIEGSNFCRKCGTGIIKE